MHMPLTRKLSTALQIFYSKLHYRIFLRLCDKDYCVRGTCPVCPPLVAELLPIVPEKMINYNICIIYTVYVHFHAMIIEHNNLLVFPRDMVSTGLLSLQLTLMITIDLSLVIITVF